MRLPIYHLQPFLSLLETNLSLSKQEQVHEHSGRVHACISADEHLRDQHVFLHVDLCEGIHLSVEEASVYVGSGSVSQSFEEGEAVGDDL